MPDGSEPIVSKPILVTGSSGFLGRFVTAELARAGYSLETFSSKECDLSDEQAVARHLGQTEYGAVVHLAGRMPGAAGDSLASMLASNVIATDNLLRHVGTRHLVHVSSLDVYGVPVIVPLTEESATDPATDYGVSKLAGEKIALRWGASHPAPVCILRPTQIIGPGDQPIKFMPRCAERLARGEQPQIFGDGADLRDLIHARDVARAVCAALARQASGVFNIATGTSRSIAEYVDRLIRASGRNVKPVFLPRAKPRVDLSCDVKRAVNGLGFQAEEDLDAALRGIYEAACGLPNRTA